LGGTGPKGIGGWRIGLARCGASTFRDRFARRGRAQGGGETAPATPQSIGGCAKIEGRGLMPQAAATSASRGTQIPFSAKRHCCTQFERRLEAGTVVIDTDGPVGSDGSGGSPTRRSGVVARLRQPQGGGRNCWPRQGVSPFTRQHFKKSRRRSCWRRLDRSNCDRAGVTAMGRQCEKQLAMEAGHKNSWSRGAPMKPAGKMRKRAHRGSLFTAAAARVKHFRYQGATRRRAAHQRHATE